MIKFYDVDGDGNVSYEEFLSGLRDEMSPRRLKMVQKVFSRMDRDGSGKIDINDVIGVFDVSTNADFIENRKTKDGILNEFLVNFEGAHGNKDAVITAEEFFDYYSDLSMSVPNDEYFVRIMESAW